MWKIERLTEDQRALVETVCKEWATVGLSAEPVDHRAAEAACQLAYLRLGRGVPPCIVWADSPLAACLTSIILREISKRPLESRNGFLDFIRLSIQTDQAGQVLDRVWERLNTPAPLDEAFLQRVGGCLSAEFALQVWHEWDKARTLPAVHPSVSNFVRNTISEHQPTRTLSDDSSIGFAVTSQLHTDLSSELWRVIEMARMAPVDMQKVIFCDCMAHLKLHMTKLGGIIGVMRQCGGWDPSRGAAVLIERPSWIFMDNERRLHSHAGAALQYPDSWGIYAWHGVRVPKQVILQPETLTPKQILNEPNAEVRRVMMERFGLDRLLAAIPRKRCLDIDQEGRRRLYRLSLRDDEPILAVRVQCPSTGQIYFLRVPPHVRTCRDAVAWAFGFEKSEEYQPVAET